VRPSPRPPHGTGITVNAVNLYVQEMTKLSPSFRRAVADTTALREYVGFANVDASLAIMVRTVSNRKNHAIICAIPLLIFSHP
jgi:hypothetical protein